MENFFAFYDLPFSLHVDQTQLRKRFYEFSRKFHPDFHAQASSDVQDEILQKSTLNNKAFESLSNQDKRIKYILDYKELLQEGQNAIPQDFLMEMMDYNESLMELEMDFNLDAKSSLKQNLIKLSEDLFQSIEALNEPNKLLDGASLEKLKAYYLKNQYLKNLFRKLEEMSSHI